MKSQAVFAVEKNVVRLQGFDIDESALKPDQVIVKNRYSVISPGTELDCVSGKESSWFHFPQQLGYCAVGEIIAAGAGVTHFAVGDAVLAVASHASHAVVDEPYVRAKVPAGVDLADAVWANIALISITALRASRADLGDYAVVLGQGLVGNLAAQLFRAQGCRVIAVDRLATRLDISRQCGVEHVVNASETDAIAAVKDLTHGRGAEVVVEATGSPAAALQAVEMGARNGEVILLGTPRGTYDADIVPLLRAVHRASPNLTLKGAHGYSIPQEADPYVKHSVARNADVILEMIRRRELALAPLVSAVIKPEKATDAYAQLRDHPATALGMVFDWT